MPNTKLHYKPGHWKPSDEEQAELGKIAKNALRKLKKLFPDYGYGIGELGLSELMFDEMNRQIMAD